MATAAGLGDVELSLHPWFRIALIREMTPRAWKENRKAPAVLYRSAGLASSSSPDLPRLRAASQGRD